MDFFTMRERVRASWVLRLLPAITAILFITGSVFGQSITCAATAVSTTTIHAEGLAEPVGNVALSCTGGTAGSMANLTMFLGLNTNITNRLDMNGLPVGITVAVSGANAFSAGTLSINGMTLFINNLTYTVPAIPASPVTITIGGLRAAAGTLTTGTGTPIVYASVNGIGAAFTNASQLSVGVTATTLLSTIFNNGISCSGSPLPATLDFPGFAAANSVNSVVRVTEASPNAFTKRALNDDTGVRFLVKLSGYSAGARVFVPDAIVGSDGSVPTSSGILNTTVNGGTYTPASFQFLLLRVNGADANGAGGYLPAQVPLIATTFTSLTEIGLSGGAGYAVYEVADSNPNIVESAQIPLYLVAPQIACTAPAVVPTLSVALAPVSNVAIATAADPIPRFIAGTPGSDCKQLGDCGASYFPNLVVDTTPINLTGASLGNKQGATLAVSNSGSGVINFTTSIAYGPGASNWLTVVPGSGQNSMALQVFADPSMLQPGTYVATITVSAAGFSSIGVPVTFTVGPAGVTISNVLNAASGTAPVAPGSYTAIYGLNLAGQNVSVTFNQLPATVVFDSATQINLIVPAALGSALAADVVVTVNGRTSNSFKTSLALNQPGIFNPGIENADGSVNTASNPATRGSFVAVYLTGLAIPLTGQVTVNIGGQNNLIPLYAGAQPSLPALDQVNVTVPATLPTLPNLVPLTICIPGSNGQPVCSNQANLYIQ